MSCCRSIDFGTTIGAAQEIKEDGQLQELFPSSPTTKVSTNSYGEYHLNIQCFSFGFGPLNTFHLSLIHSSGSGFSFRLLRLPLHQKVRGCRKWKRSSNLPKTSTFLLSVLLLVVLEGREVLSPPPTVFSFARFYCASGFRLPFSSVVSRFTGWPREHNTNLPAPCPARKCGTSHLLSPSLN